MCECVSVYLILCSFIKSLFMSPSPQLRQRIVLSLQGFPPSVHSLSRVRLFATPWTAACLASLSITNSQSSLKLKDSLVILFYIHIQLPSSLPLSPWATMNLTHLYNFIIKETEICSAYLLRWALFTHCNSLGIHPQCCMHQWFLPFLLLSTIPWYGQTALYFSE